MVRNSPPYLPTVELAIDHEVHLILIYIYCSLDDAHLVKKMLPDLLSRVAIQIVISQHDMNSAEDCVIKLTHSVGGEKKDPLTIFQLAKKH